MEELELSLRVRNVLRRNGIHDLSSLIVRYYSESLWPCVNIGKGTVEEIGEFLKTVNPAVVEAFRPKTPPARPVKKPARPRPQKERPRLVGRLRENWPDDAELERCREVEVDALELSSRARNALKRNGIYDLYALILKCYGGGLFSCAYVGEHTVREVEALVVALNPDAVKALLSEARLAPEADSGAAGLPEDILRRPVKDLSISRKLASLLQGMKVETIGQALGIGEKDAFAREHWAAYQDLLGALQRLKRLGGRSFNGLDLDIGLIRKLRKSYGFKQAWLSRWLNVSSQRVSKRLRKPVNCGRWEGAGLKEDDERVFAEMAASGSYFRKAGGKEYLILNNRQDDAALLAVEGKSIRCWFLADLPEGLRGAIVGAEMHRLSARENPPRALGKVVSILKKEYFCPYDPVRFRKLAEGRGMPPREYAMWRYRLPYCPPIPGLVTDEKIVKFFEKNLVDGKVVVSGARENNWIRAFCSRHGFSLRKFIEFYGFEGARE